MMEIMDKTEFENYIDELNKETRAWELRAARGECQWICADCSCTFDDGMPDACIHGHQGCTDIIRRNKENAIKQG